MKDEADADFAADAALFADLASNVFVVGLILLIVASVGLGLQGRERGDAVPRDAAPLGAAEALRMLVDRRPGAPGLSLDVLADGIRLGHPGAGRATLAEVREALAALSPGAPIRLYVHAHGAYGEATAMLAGARRDWREISVPRALSEWGDWSPGFRRIAAGQVNPEGFRRGVLDLLGAGVGRRAWPVVGHEPAWPASGEPLWRRLRPVLELGILLGGFAAALAIECRRRQRVRIVAARLARSRSARGR